MRSDKAYRMVDYGMSELEKIAPNDAKIELDVREDSSGEFYAQIQVKVKNKVYFVKKHSRSMYDSFHKAMRALRAQLAKNKVHNHHIGLKHLAY